MSDKAYEKIMSYLDVIESELNKVAAIVGAPSFDEWMQEQNQQS